MLKPILVLALSCCACAAQTQTAPVSPAAPAPAAVDTIAPAPVVAPDLVALQLDATQSAIEAKSARTEVVARVRLSTQARVSQTRPPTNLALVIDTSASMRGAPIEHAREAARAMIEALHEGDQLHVVVFHSKAESLVGPTRLTAASRAEILRAVDAMEAVGTTALGAGLGLAVNALTASSDPDITRRVVVLSDGIPNDESIARAMAGRASSNGIPITTMGLGLEYDETLLGEIAASSGGAFHFIEESDQVATVFREEVLRIERVVATGAQLQLQAGPDVIIRDVVGHDAAGAGSRNATLLVGDLTESDTHDVFVRLDVGPHAPGSTVELLDATLSYVDGTGTGTPLDRSGFLAVDALGDAQAVDQTRVLATELEAARAITAATILRAGVRVRNGDVRGAITMARKTERRARSLGNEHKDDALLALADELHTLQESWTQLQRRAERERNSGPRGMPHAGKHKLDAPQARSAKRSHDAAWATLH